MTVRVCPERDAACPHGVDCPYAIDRYSCDTRIEVTVGAMKLDIVERLRREVASYEGADEGTALEAAAEIQRLRKEVEELRAKADEWQKDFGTLANAVTGGSGTSAILDAKHIRSRTEAAKSRGDNHWETLRCIRDIAQNEGDLAAIVQHVDDAGSGYTERPEKTLWRLTRERDQLAAQVAGLHAVLLQHHEWHQDPETEIKLGDEYYDLASCYVDSTLEEQTSAALANTAATAEAHDKRVRCEVTDKILRLVNDRIDGLLEDEATQEPDTGEVNMPEWVETAIEELEGIATAIRSLSQDTGEKG